MADVNLFSRSSSGIAKVFVSYSHHPQDGDCKAKLDAVLKSLNKVIESKDDGAIGIGLPWWVEIMEEMQRANIIILLVSSNYLNSSHCRKEAQEAFGRAAAGKCRLFPIRIRSANIDKAPLREIQWVEPDETWKNVRQRLQEVVTQVANGIPAGTVLRSWDELKGEIGERIECAKSLCLMATTGLGYFRDFGDELHCTRNKWLLFMNPKCRYFDMVMELKLQATNKWSRVTTPAIYRKNARALFSDIHATGNTHLRVTNMPMTASALFINQAFSGEHEVDTVRKLKPSRSSMLYLEIPVYLGYRQPPILRILSIGEDAPIYIKCWRDFSAAYRAGMLYH